MREISDLKQSGDGIASGAAPGQASREAPHGGEPPPQSIVVPRAVPLLLSLVAGYVDACTYLGLFGVFVAQLTGSLVLAGTGYFKTEPGVVAKLLAIPSFFLAGMAITLLVRSMRGRPQ